MLHLTGPPRLNGLLLPYADAATPVRVEWDGAPSVWREYASGKRERKRARFRCRLTFGYASLDPDVAYGIAAQIADAESVFVRPRTRRAGDPAWAADEEHEFRLVAPLDAATSPRRRRAALAFELESVVTYPALPDLQRGGFRLEALADPAAPEVRAYGDAEFLVEERAVVLFGQPYTIRTARPHVPGLSALHVEQVERGAGPYAAVERVTFAARLPSFEPDPP